LCLFFFFPFGLRLTDKTDETVIDRIEAFAAGVAAGGMNWHERHIDHAIVSELELEVGEMTLRCGLRQGT